MVIKKKQKKMEKSGLPASSHHEQQRARLSVRAKLFLVSLVAGGYKPRLSKGTATTCTTSEQRRYLPVRKESRGYCSRGWQSLGPIQEHTYR